MDIVLGKKMRLSEETDFEKTATKALRHKVLIPILIFPCAFATM